MDTLGFGSGVDIHPIFQTPLPLPGGPVFGSSQATHTSADAKCRLYTPEHAHTMAERWILGGGSLCAKFIPDSTPRP